jgi:cyclic dehypoxanthinyl futalosine synthase
MVAAISIQAILDKAIAGGRLTAEEGLRLLESHDLAAIGRAADAVARRMHPEPYRTYNIDRNINYTNICTAVCDFCAFYRPPKHAEGYVLDQEELLQKIQETVELGGDQILMQGGLHPQFKLQWYEELLRDIKARFPQVNVHGFSPPEIHHFTKIAKLPLRMVLKRLKAAGLGSLPGGGGEILVDRVRKAVTRGKVLTDDWLNVHRVWHELGGRSTATMMFGHVETLAERIEHLERLRQLQDETSGFTAFIGWTFQPEHTGMADIPPAGSFEYLKTQAVSRLYLDNFRNIQSSWVTQGLKTGQLAMLYGANDMGSLMIEENVVAEAGTVHYLTLDEIRNAISELGYTPRQRNVFYELLSEPHEQAAVESNRARYQQIRATRRKPGEPAGFGGQGPLDNGSSSSAGDARPLPPPPIVPLTVVSGDGTA